MLGLRRIRDLCREGSVLLVETATFADANRFPLMLCPTGRDSPYEPTSCTFFNIAGFTQTVRSIGFAVARHCSLMNLPLVEVAPDQPAPIDRTVFTCMRDTGLDDRVTLDYWDDGAARPPNWKGETS